MGSFSHSPEGRLVLVMRLLAEPVRLRILLAIGSREVCLCHILAAVPFPKRYVQRQLVQVKEAGFVASRRKGVKTFYRMAYPGLLEMIAAVARLTGTDGWVSAVSSTGSIPGCPCPVCHNQLACPRDSKKDLGACWVENFPENLVNEK